MDEIKSFIDKYQALLALDNSISYTEAEKRASHFLSAIAHLTNWRHLLGSEKIRLTSVQAAVYSHEMSKAEGSTITQNKITVEASVAYKHAREELEAIENDLSYLKAYYEIFMNGHLFYRQMAKGDNQ